MAKRRWPSKRSRSTIAGQLDLGALSLLRDPSGRATLRVEAVSLKREGLTPRAIARALNVPEASVQQLLLPPECSRRGGEQ